jgi:hypothetical protein
VGLIRRFLPILLALALALPSTAHASGAGDEVVFGEELVVGADDVLDDDLLVIGGTVEIQSGGRVDGKVTLINGTVTIDGEVGGDVRQFGGTLDLNDGAQIAGDLISTGGKLIQSEAAEIEGEIRTGNGDDPPPDAHDGYRGIVRVIVDTYVNLFTLLAMAGLALVAGVLWPRQLAVIESSITGNPVMSGAVGLLTIGVVVPVFIIAALTLILIPVSLAGLVVLGAAAAFGWIALSLAVGRRIGEAVKRDLSPGIAAGIGALLLGLIFIGIERVPCVGWVMQAAIGLVGLGAVVMTRFGTMQETVISNQ